MSIQKRNTLLGKLIYFITVLIMIGIIMFLYGIYKEHYYGDFVKSEYVHNGTSFVRDNNIKYSKNASYKLESATFNDAMFYKEVAVEQGKPYKVTCMVKTQGVKNQKDVSGGGAQISIEDTTERSNSITGTNDWQKVEFLFDSKNRTSVKLGFRLGGYDDNSKGTVWFSDFTIEEGIPDQDSTWKVACFVFNNLDVTVDNQKIKLSMSLEDAQDIANNMERFKNSSKVLSYNKMTVDYDIIPIQNPITSLTYDEKNGYYVAPENVQGQIDKYLQQTEYDHIFAVVRLGDMMHQNDIPVFDWIGLGGIEYRGIGFSNIRLPNNEHDYIYKYDGNINTFPEEVYIHEFLHSLERTSIDYGNQIPALHDYEKQGYKNQRLEGLRKWYEDYMQCNIRDIETGNKIGLNQDIYTTKPVHNSDFEYSYKMNVFKEPSNIIEDIQEIIKSIANLFPKTTAK